MGRPSIFTPVLAERIITQIEQGKSLRGICEADDMPHRSTIQDWLAKDDEFASRYARACDVRTEVHVDEMIDIADDPKLDPADKKVRIDTRKWIASKLKAHKYGDRVQVEGKLTLEQLVGQSIPQAE